MCTKQRWTKRWRVLRFVVIRVVIRVALSDLILAYLLMGLRLYSALLDGLSAPNMERKCMAARLVPVSVAPRVLNNVHGS